MDHSGSNERGVGDYSDIVDRIGNLLPLALAVLDFESVFGKLDRKFYGNPRSPLDESAEEIILFIDEHFAKETPGAIVRKRHITSDVAKKLLDFHETVNYYAAIVSKLALENMPGSGGFCGPCSATEAHRFTKSLYIWHLAGLLFPRDDQLNAANMERAMDLEPAWRHFWQNFAPWELQQVRCAHELLTEHIQAAIKSDAVSRGKKRAVKYNLPLLRPFVANEGLAALKYLEGSSSEKGLEGAVVMYQKFRANWRLPEVWYRQHDTLYLDQTDELTNLDVSGVLSKYPEADSGPADAWMCTLLRIHLDDVTFQEGSHVFQCGEHATMWGYLFWDRERLDSLTNNTLPATATMEDASKIFVLTEDVAFSGGFRLPTSCTCKRMIL